ncbi:MerR family transcriptional regulator [Microbacterium sp. NPDC056234]|uniref:MerR family transcriptional regulator n=1 Tax=Microbacterium sp. NPDC056234 TaxID=3345757 RepID=UPI0035D9E90A
MQIGELARLTGVSARALRHYEDQGVLVPVRTKGGYRDYTEEDVTRVAQIKAMIAAGLNVATIQRYLDCASGGNHGVSLEICPNLRAELTSIAEHIVAKQADLRERQLRLHELASIG